MPSELEPGTAGTLLESEGATIPDGRSATRSSPASARDETATQFRLIHQNLDLVFTKIDQMASVLSASADALESTRREMVTTLELAQQMIARQDEQIEHLGEATASMLEYLGAHEPSQTPNR